MGQRKCIGDTFATVEAQLPGQTFEPEPVITLRPRGGVQVVASRR